MMKKLNILELKVLRYLSEDARIPFSFIGKKIRRSQQHVSYIVNSLTKKGILQNFYSLIDYSMLDVINFCVYFKVNYVNKQRYEAFLKRLIKDKHTSWIATCSGRYDVIVTFLTTNPSQFNKILKKIIKEFFQEVADYDVLTTVVNHWYGREYLFKNGNEEDLIYGGDRKPVDLGELDLKLLSKISDKARESSVTLGHSLSVTPKTIINHIKRLQNKKIIIGFKPLIHVSKFDYIFRLILVKYNNSSIQLENKFINYLKTHPNITCVSKTLGTWDIEIEIECKNINEFRKIEMELREKFVLLIKDIESFPLNDILKRNYFPGFLV